MPNQPKNLILLTIPRSTIIDIGPTTGLKALTVLLTSTPRIPAGAALFSYSTPGGYAHLTQQHFVKILWVTLTMCGYPATRYSGHSFRRGGATFSSSCNVPLEAIKAQGDWRSSVEQYLPKPLELRHKLSKTLAECIIH